MVRPENIEVKLKKNKRKAKNMERCQRGWGEGGVRELKLLDKFMFVFFLKFFISYLSSFFLIGIYLYFQFKLRVHIYRWNILYI